MAKPNTRRALCIGGRAVVVVVVAVAAISLYSKLWLRIKIRSIHLADALRCRFAHNKTFFAAVAVAAAAAAACLEYFECCGDNGNSNGNNNNDK